MSESEVRTKNDGLCTKMQCLVGAVDEEWIHVGQVVEICINSQVSENIRARLTSNRTTDALSFRKWYIDQLRPTQQWCRTTPMETAAPAVTVKGTFALLKWIASLL